MGDGFKSGFKLLHRYIAPEKGTSSPRAGHLLLVAGSGAAGPLRVARAPGRSHGECRPYTCRSGGIGNMRRFWWFRVVSGGRVD